MSNAIYPVLPGLAWNVLRKPNYNTKVQMAASGSSLTAGFYSAPLRSWTLNYDFLRNANNFNELDTIASFFNARNGKFDSFLFEDPDDKSVIDHGFGMGDGATLAFQLQRTIAGTYLSGFGGQTNSPLSSKPRWNFVASPTDMSVWGTSNNASGLAPVITTLFDYAPDGTKTAGRLVLQTNGTTGSDWSLVQSYSALTAASAKAANLMNGDTVCPSVWMRTTDGSTVQVQLNAAGQNAAGSIVTVTPVWQRFYSTCIVNDDTIMGIRLGIDGTSAQKRVDLLVWGAQCEESLTPTDFMANSRALNSAPVASAPSYWPASANGFEPINNVNLFQALLIYRQDWQGRQLQYSRARTNLIIQSNAFNTTWTPSGTTVTADNTTGPDGTVTADKLLETAVTATHTVSQNVTLNRSQVYTFSLWAKADVRTRFNLGISGGTAANFVGGVLPNAEVDLTAKTITPSGCTATLAAYPGGWYKATITFTTNTGVPTASTFAVSLRNATGTASYLGVITNGLWLFGAQLEAELAATSYIPTTTVAASVTDYTLSTSGVVTFPVAPVAGAILSWTGNYWWRVRFKNDAQEFDNFMSKLYTAKKVELELDR